MIKYSSLFFLIHTSMIYHYSLVQPSHFLRSFECFERKIEMDVFYGSTLGRWTFRPPSYPVSTWCFWSRSRLEQRFRKDEDVAHCHLQDVRDPERDYKLAKHLISLHKGSQHEEPALIAVIPCHYLKNHHIKTNRRSTRYPSQHKIFESTQLSFDEKRWLQSLIGTQG